MATLKDGIDKYFASARERYDIKLRRDRGKKPPWTKDTVFRQFRFCNVHREDDRTTVWFRENIRKHLTGLRVVEATLAFRWFNRIETGEKIKDILLNGWDPEAVRERLEGVKPVVTGAYMIKTEEGLSKLDGVIKCIDKAIPKLPKLVIGWGSSIQQATEELTNEVYNLGPFLAYEITTDLRHTSVLGGAKDIMTWANPGPGCARGLNWVHHGDKWGWWRNEEKDVAEMLELMKVLLDHSRNPDIWPSEWPAWEMRTVEHWSCEFDKWCRGTEGQTLKRRFRLSEEAPDVPV